MENNKQPARPMQNRLGGNGRPPRNGQNKPKDGLQLKGTSTRRSEAIRAQRRNAEMAEQAAGQYKPAEGEGETRRANFIDDSPRLKVIGLGGMDGGGSKNMVLIEYANDAVVIDAGSDLGVDLPGINYAIPDTSYLDQIKNKIKAFVITHGHLDHIGALPHILPKFPGVPVYGSKFTIGRVEEIFQNFGLPMPDGFELKTVVMNETTHEKLKIGEFFVELVRVTHSIPGSTVVVIDTPGGRVINTGDFRLDPNPLDHEKTDTERLTELGKEGVEILLSESTTTERPGRTPSESTIEKSFIDIIDQAPGRVFIALFSTNINRVQMIINAAAHHNRRIAMEGRSMMSTLEMAVRHGFVKVPKGTFIPINSTASLPDEQLVVVCTGSQGEPNSALQRMSLGEHPHVKLKAQDTVVLSSTPIPESGNDARIGEMVDDLMKMGVHVFRHETHDLDGCGPLHVSGHASMDEYRDMINMTNPKFFMPIYGSYRSKQRHLEMAVELGIPRKNTFNAVNGQVVAVNGDKLEVIGETPNGSVLVDQTGALVSNVVVKDRMILAQDGLVVVVLTVDRKNGQLLTSPDIITRGFIYIRDNEEMMTELRNELRRAVAQRFGRIDLDRFKAELKDHVTHMLYESTQRSPVVIPVINVLGGVAPQKSGDKHDPKRNDQGGPAPVEDQQKRFAQLRAQLLNQDARVD